MRHVQRLSGQGIDLAYSEAGTGDPVVLIMGLGAGSEAWAAHVKAWSRSFRCIAVDNRGAGASSAPPGPYSTSLMADDYAELVTALGLGPARVVGLSMGGATAQELALHHPNLVSRLVLVSTWARLDRRSAEIFANLAAVRGAVDQQTYTQLLQLWIWSRAWFDAHGAELAAERSADAPAMQQHAFAAQVAACVGHDSSDRLGAIDVPTLITAGDEDTFTPLHHARALVDGIAGARLEVFAGAAHTHHWEDLDRFNGLVEGWLR